MRTDSVSTAESAIEQSVVANEVQFAIARKLLSARKEQGQAVVDLVKQAAELQRQLAAGRIDVRI